MTIYTSTTCCSVRHLSVPTAITGAAIDFEISVFELLIMTDSLSSRISHIDVDKDEIHSVPELLKDL